MLSAGGFLAVMGLLGVAVGVLVRHTTGAVLVVLGLGLVPTLFGGMFPTAVQDWVLDYLPGRAGTRVIEPDPAVADYLVLGAWAAGLAVLAYLVLRRRDA